MQNKLRRLRRGEKKKQKNGYVGHSVDIVEITPIMAQVTPVTDSASVAIYGEKITKMYNLICEAKTDIKIGEYVEIDGQDCKVVSVLRYSQHTVATVEMTGMKWGNADGD